MFNKQGREPPIRKGREPLAYVFDVSQIKSFECEGRMFEIADVSFIFIQWFACGEEDNFEEERETF